MTVKFTNVRAGVRHSRSTFSRTLICDTPDWVSRIGASGGEHTLDTCVSCAVAKIIRDAHVDHVWRDDNDNVLSDDASFFKASHREQVTAQRNDYLSLSDKEYAFLTSKQSERIMRIAQFCPVRRIPEMLREMRAFKALALKQAAQCSDVADQCVMRSILAEQAANTLWQRWREATSDTVVLARLRIELSGLWEPLRSAA